MQQGVTTARGTALPYTKKRLNSKTKKQFKG